MSIVDNKFNIDNIQNEIRQKKTISEKLNFWHKIIVKYIDEPIAKIQNEGKSFNEVDRYKLISKLFTNSCWMPFFPIPKTIYTEHFESVINEPEFTFWFLKFNAKINYKVLIDNLHEPLDSPVAIIYIQKELKKIKQNEKEAKDLLKDGKVNIYDNNFNSEYHESIELLRIKAEYYIKHQLNNALSTSNETIELYAKHVYFKHFLKTKLKELKTTDKNKTKNKKSVVTDTQYPAEDILKHPPQSKVPAALSFAKENCKTHIDTWNKDNNNNLFKWLQDGLMVEIEKNLFMGKDNLQNQKKELDNLYEQINLNIINLNNLQEEIKFNCQQKILTIKNSLNNFFSDSHSTSTLMPLHSLCPRIIEQPLYLIDAVEKFPDDLTKNKKIYSRHKYLIGKLGLGKDKFLEYRHGLNRIIREDLSNQDKKLVNSIFLFMDQFIDDLSSLHHNQFNYFESPLFKVLFEEIMKFKGYYISAFDKFTFENILKIEKLLKKNETNLENALKSQSIESQVSSRIEERYSYNNLENNISITRASGNKYQLKLNNDTRTKYDVLVSGFCIFLLWKKQLIINAKTISGNYPRWEEDKDSLFEDYYEPVLKKHKGDVPPELPFSFSEFIKEQVKNESSNLHKLERLHSNDFSMSFESVKRWTTDYLVWLNSKLTIIGCKTLLSSTSEEYKKSYNKSLSSFLEGCEATEFDYIKQELEYFKNTLSDIDNSESSHDGYSLTGIQNFTDAFEVVGLIGYKKFHYATMYKIKFLENKMNTLASGDTNDVDKPTGFNSNLSDKQIEKLFEKMKPKFIDKKTNINHFAAIFSTEPLPVNFIRISWVDTTTRKDRGTKSNQISLAGFLKFAMDYKHDKPDQIIINNCFSDFQGKDFILGNIKKDDYLKRKVNKFKEMAIDKN